ncbi:ABC transporter G family member 21 [Prunus yedoensis var. nudiflora]|uniref:ABC transporter G family member 21 n=1 Tax=Prunus yedoensis var. nudiflora TaxID=2094558 RepID=A0A314YWP4_PRUYE|nr:ABC transporter G family member 21 [Prunus yedoensis var. nudiflora]
MSIGPDAKQDDQLEYNGRLEHQEDQNTTKQFLISSYKKNLYPVLKAEIQQSHKDTVLAPSRTTPSSRGSGKYQWTTSWWEQFKAFCGGTLTLHIYKIRWDFFSSSPYFGASSLYSMPYLHSPWKGQC